MKPNLYLKGDAPAQSIEMGLEYYGSSPGEIALKANGVIIARITTYGDEPELMCYDKAAGFRFVTSNNWVGRPEEA